MTKDKLNSLFFPIIKTKNDLEDLISRAVWYFNCMENIENIYFIIDIEYDLNNFVVPDYLADDIKSLFNKNRSKIILVNYNEKKVKELFDKCDIIMLWDMENYPSQKWKDRIEKAQSNNKKQIWRVDKLRERYEGSFYIKVGLTNYPDKEEIIKSLNEKFIKFINEVAIYDKSYIFGTGPSVDRYKEFDFSDGISIICNSIILDEELLNYVKPKILVFADPIFHFGCSKYAYSFRKQLKNVVDKYDLTIIIPFNYYRLFVGNYPEFKDRTIAVPMSSTNPINLNLRKDFYIRSISNILTLLLFPLASTITNEINMIGFDGRKTIENTYFWKHNPKTQFNDKMENIQEVHPSFFNIDYNNYYSKHQNTVKEWIDELIKLGKKINLLTSSYVPILRKFYKFKGDSYDNEVYPLVSIIMPFYNNSDTIERSITSLIDQQHYENWELIVVDDGSEESEKKVLKKFSKKDKRIKIFYTDHKGVSYARNMGIRKSSGKYIGFLDSDDIYFPNALYRRMEELIDNDYDAVTCPAQMLDKNFNTINWSISKGPKIFSFLSMETAPFIINSIIAKKELFFDVGLFDETLTNAEDWDLYQKLGRIGVIFHHINDVFVGYRQTNDNTVNKDFLKHYRGIEEVLDIVNSKDSRLNENQVKEPFIYGLGHAHNIYVKRKRLIQVLIWNALSKKIGENVKKQALEIEPILLKICILNSDFKFLLKYTISRFYIIDPNNWIQYLKKDREIIIDTFTNLFNKDRYDFMNRIEFTYYINQIIESTENNISKNDHKNILNKKNVMIKNRDRAIANLKNQVQQKDRIIHDIKKSKSWKIGNFQTRIIKKMLGWLPFLRKKMNK